MNHPCFLRPILAALLLLVLAAAPAPARPLAPAGAGAVSRAAPAALPFADGWRRYFVGLATRSRVIQVAAVGMILALFIIMKK
jgi:hypothetical protein